MSLPAGVTAAPSEPLKLKDLYNFLKERLEQNPSWGEFNVTIEFPNMEVRESMRQAGLDAHWEMMGHQLVINCAAPRQKG